MSSALTIYISGVHGGPNPSPGLGTALSLRQAFPHARLVAKDHSVKSTGIHHPVFDDVWLCRPWNEIELEDHHSQIVERLEDEDAWLISGLDLEVRWLGAFQHARALLPRSEASKSVSKPGIQAAEHLPAGIPEWIEWVDNQWAAYEFCQNHRWPVWVKGSAYDGIKASSWTEILRAATALRQAWKDDTLFLQEDIRGREVSIAFSALNGSLINAVYMEKRQVTEQGKTWGGRILAVPPQLDESLRATLRRLEWTGGGELEFVEDAGGRLWLIDWNPRFPAWIHGTTLSGKNLPADLISAATGTAGEKPEAVCSEFVRVVVEIPIRQEYPLPQLPPLPPDPLPGGKHPSGMPLLMQQLTSGVSPSNTDAIDLLDAELASELTQKATRVTSTPCRIFLSQLAIRTLTQAKTLSEAVSADGFLKAAYSLKTNSNAELLKAVRDIGFLAEVISMEEAEWAQDIGFPCSRIVYNGPVPPGDHCLDNGSRILAVFADSIESYEVGSRSFVGQTIGVRLRVPSVDSRFGVDVSSPDEFDRTALAIQRCSTNGFGVSFHTQSSMAGIERWETIARSCIEFAVALSEASAREVTMFDFGGGWGPGVFRKILGEVLPGLIGTLKARLPSVKCAIIEPGKALAEPCEVVYTRVAEIRQSASNPKRRVVIVDAAVSEVPLIQSFPHRLAFLRNGKAELIGSGQDTILGRSCMEDDRLASNVALPRDLKAGELLAICDVGAYDSSMAYAFGRGGRR